MTPRSLVRRGLRTLLRWWWQTVRPPTGGPFPDAGEARPAHIAGRPPTPQERWRPTTPASGPWSDVDPTVTPFLPRRSSVLAVAAWGALVGLRLRRDLRAYRAEREG
jgi:hypothetical protein